MANGITNELQAEFRRRQSSPDCRPRHRRADRRYSLRAFAEDLDLSHGFLSRVLRGERHLSQDQADAIGRKIGLSDDERLRFVDLARLSAMKNKRLQRAVLMANPALRPSTGNDEDSYSLLNPSEFSILKRWYYPALMELVKVAPRRHTARALAKRLALTIVECEVALERLAENGFISKSEHNGELVFSPVSGPLKTGNIPSPKIREFHQQMLSKAKESLEHDSTDNTHITGITFAADASSYDQARQLIDEFRKRLAEVMRVGDPKSVNSVYQFNVQLFRLDKVETPKAR